MKHLFTLIIAFCFLGSRANDTLTLAEVYSFSVGDTFDYKGAYVNTIGYQDYLREYYFRLIISEMNYSADMDTLVITYNDPNGYISYDTINGLSRKAIYSIDSMFPGTNQCQYHYSIQNSPFSSRPTNEIQEACFERGSHYRYGYGLGKMYHRYGHGNGADGFEAQEVELIYFSNSDTTIGTPYNIANGSPLIQFVPLPEECASWTRVIQTPVNSQGYDAIIEQIRTGSKTVSNGRTYVELMYRCVNRLTDTFTPDSLLGYFYNDTVTKRVMFAASIGPANIVLYDFNMLNGVSCGLGGVLVVSTTTIDGEMRTRWDCNAIGGIPQIAGIGGLSGLIRIREHQFSSQYPNYGSLTCFSVCGEVLYPENNAKYCDLLTSIDEQFNESMLSLYPNPATRQVTFNQNGAKYTGYSVVDVNGSTVMSGPINGSSAIISTANLAAGMYFFRAYNNNGNSISRKLMVE